MCDKASYFNLFPPDKQVKMQKKSTGIKPDAWK